MSGEIAIIQIRGWHWMFILIQSNLNILHYFLLIKSPFMAEVVHLFSQFNTLVQKREQRLAVCHAVCWPFIQHHGSNPPLDLLSATDTLPATSGCIKTLQLTHTHTHTLLTMKPNVFTDLSDLCYFNHLLMKNLTSILDNIIHIQSYIGFIYIYICMYTVYNIHLNMGYSLYPLEGYTFPFSTLKDKYQLCTQDIIYSHSVDYYWERFGAQHF